MQYLRKNKWLPVVPVFALLFAQATPVLWRMDCLSSGRTVLSWGHARSCMPGEDKGSGSEVAPLCCKYTHAGGERTEYVKLPDPTRVHPVAVALTWTPVLAPLHTCIARTVAWARPPPLPPEDRSIRYRQLLI